jgi:hypothetical protein
MTIESKSSQQIGFIFIKEINFTINGDKNNPTTPNDKKSSTLNSLYQNFILSKIKNCLLYICFVQFFQDKIKLILEIIFKNN